jgi:two-component system sensor histidine kinase UhpB
MSIAPPTTARAAAASPPAASPQAPAAHRSLKARSLLAQVLVVNLLLVAATATVATAALGSRTQTSTPGREAAVFGLATVATLLGNWILLRRRFAPLDEMISRMERADLSHPEVRAPLPAGFDIAEVQRLDAAFQRMLSRLESERRQAGRAAIEAQERERRRIAQDLHDEVNQALTAVSLRLQASIEQAPPELKRELTETKRLSSQAMEELLVLARQLRPAVLDDHGLVPALHSQVRDFADQTHIEASFSTRGQAPWLSPEQQLVIYRVTQESLSNIAQHADARRVQVELSFIGRTILRINDDGRGFATGRDGGLGLSGMRERALLAGGQLSIWSSPGQGTRVELIIS